MRKYINAIKHTLLLLSIAVWMIGCDDFLNEEPDNRLKIDNLEQVQALLVNAYPEGNWLFVEWLSDNTGLTLTNYMLPHMVQIYTYDNVVEKAQDTPTYYWTSAYRAIAHANVALNALEKIQGVDGNQKKALQAEAYLCRSYAHFMLANLFAKPYDPATADKEPGIPYVTEVEDRLVVDYTRNSIAEVYEKAEADMLQGLKLKEESSENFYKSLKYHFSHNAALGYASRFYLFKKDYDKCKEYADKLLGKSYNKSFIKDYRKVNMGHPTRNAQRFSSYDDASNLMLSRVEVYAHPYYQVGYRTNFDIFNKIYFQGNQDLRAIQSFFGNKARTSIYLPKHYSAVRDDAFPYMITVPFRGEEVFLNRLEALWYKGDIAEMERQLALFVADRYVNGDESMTYDKYYKEYTAVLYPGYSKKETLLKIILDERRREFFDEGLRWLDIRRYRMLPIEHEDVNGIVYSLTEEQLTLQIPEDAIVNGLKANPMRREIKIND